MPAWWKQDPFSAKWATIAEAYGVLRGAREKEDAPLDQFIAIAVPHIDIISLAQYPGVMGWAVILPGDADEAKISSVQRLFAPSISQLPAAYTSTKVSAGTANGHAALSMAVQPTAQIPASFTPETSESPVTPLVGPADELLLSPLSVRLQGELEIALGMKQADGNNAFTAVKETVTEASSYPYNNMFDPTSEFEMSFFDTAADNEAMADSGAFATFRPSADMTMEDMLNLDYNTYINETSFV
ncbi:hypothetical protein LTR78_005774 [Recurvomyces mirabilis]|uniref:Mating-type protein MAT-1 n=1 Tax=Recurvomyces mirabilis TaxID=574656 RepID=A0AAE1C158_9PEZI|nr:hypothetical protein LTR78_005774 [Recurvomyces mirabilis]KAK5154154.1 hypothetical protein LTS14_006839 [Recurvomyces mirabilis]